MSEAPANPRYEKISQGNATERPIGSGKKNGRVRELIMPSWGSGNCYLKFVDEHFGWYSLPLGKAATRKRDEAPTPEKNVLVPVLPRVYTTPDLDPAQCAVPRAGGYLYVFRGKYLWRELEVMTHGYFRDVNLHKYAGRDQRPATVQQDNRLLLPWRLDGEDQELYMTYSEVQWSWARICQLGGMDPQDFRLHPDHLPPMPADLGYNEQDTEQARAARLQQIDLSGVDAGFPVQLPEGRKARVENVAHANPKLWHIRLHHKEDVPVVYLHDPLGVAIENLEAYKRKEAELLGELEQARQHPHYRSAVLTWQTFFNETLWKKAPRKRRQRGPDHYADTGDEADLLRKAAREMDKDYIRSILHVEQRNQLREEMRTLKAHHFKWLQGKDPEGKNITDTHPDAISLEALLLDYATLPRQGYAQLWAAMDTLLLYAAHDPSLLDAGHDTHEERGRPKAKEDPGIQYLESLLQPDHPLHCMLFPASEQVDLSTPDYAVNPYGRDETPDPSGSFRPVAFAGAMVAARKLSPEKTAEVVIREADKVIASFILKFERMWSTRGKGSKKIDVEGFIRLAKATALDDLKGLHLIEEGASTQGKVILSGKISVLEPLRAAANTAYGKPATQSEGAGKQVRVIDPKTGQALFSQRAADVAQNPGLPPRMDDETWDRVWHETSDDGARRARGRFIVTEEVSPYALKFNDESAMASKGTELAVDALDAGRKVFPPLVYVLEWMNLREANKKAVENSSSKAIPEVFLASIAVAHATIELPLKIAGDERGVQFWVRTMPREKWKTPTKKFLESKFTFRYGRSRITVRTLGAFGASLSGAGAVMAGWDAFNRLAEGDDDAAIAHGVQALAGIMLFVCDLGAATTAGAGALAAFGPWGWAALAVFLGAGIVAAMLRDTPIEKWAKHGPFAKDPEDRGTYEYSQIKRDENGEIVYQKDNIQIPEREPLPPEKMYEALMSLLMKPRVTLIADSGILQVEVVAPGFRTGHSRLEVDATAQVEYRMSPQERAMAISAGYNQAAYQDSWMPGVQMPLELLEWSPIRGEDGHTQIGMRYRYGWPDLGNDGRRRISRFRARARHLAGDGLIIPTLPGEDSRPEKTREIDPDEPGWVYARKGMAQ